MSKIVVADRIRLGQDGGKFKESIHAAVERKGAKVSDAYVEKENKLSSISGRLWVIDEEETAERDNLLAGTAESPKQEGKSKERLDMEDAATKLGIQFPANIKDDTLMKKIAAAEADSLTGE